MKFLPVGIQNFEQMITGNFLYVDKTGYIYEMVRPPQGFYFLAKPRRFGKSLTVSTLEYLFQGRKDLFDNLSITNTDWQWKEHPVITLDFSRINSRTPEELEKSLVSLIHELARKYDIGDPGTSIPDCFARLIAWTSEKTGQKVVVLIDEYDKPLIEHLGKGESALSIAKQNRDLLKPFFGALKASDVSAALRFVFITGISKFSRISILSDLNNLNDISMQDKFSAMLGYTDEELEQYFTTDIDRLMKIEAVEYAEIRKKINTWYDGYRFTEKETTIYNPFSLIKLFDSAKFENYWFETATPSFLVNLIKERFYPAADIEELKLPKELFSVYDLDKLAIEPLLFQTGYITIKHYDEVLYHMGYPNHEVKVSFLSYLFNDLAGIENIRLAGAYKLLSGYLRDKKIDEFIQMVQSILASIPYTQIAKQDESYYHTMFYLMLAASGVNVETEVLTSQGRIDIVVEFCDKVYIVELKCNHSSKNAIAQILKKKYYEKYIQSKKKIYLMGINFNMESRTIDDWQWGNLEKFYTP